MLMYYIAVLASGMGLTVLVLLFACLFGMPIRCASSTTILIGAGTVCLHAVFAWFAWRRVYALAALETDTMRLSDATRHMYRIALVASGSVAAPMALNAVALCFVCMRWRMLVDWGYLMQCRPHLFMTALLLISICNSEVLQLIPWRDRELRGFPTVTVVLLGAAGVLVGDLAQIGVQTYFFMLLSTQEFLGSEISREAKRGLDQEGLRLLHLASGLALLCATFALASLWSRGLRRLVILLCSRKALYVDEQYWAAGRQLPPFMAQTRAAAYALDGARASKHLCDGRLSASPLRGLPCEASSLPSAELTVATHEARRVLAQRPRPAPRDAAMRWLTEVEDLDPAERVAASPMAAAHQAGVAVDGEQGLRLPSASDDGTGGNEGGRPVAASLRAQKLRM